MRRLTAYPGADVARPTPLLRILPVHLYAGRAHVLMERSVRAYRRSWMVIASGFFEPLYWVAACVKSSAIGAVEADCRCDLGRMTSRSCRIEMLGS